MERIRGVRRTGPAMTRSRTAGDAQVHRRTRPVAGLTLPREQVAASRAKAMGDTQPAGPAVSLAGADVVSPVDASSHGPPPHRPDPSIRRQVEAMAGYDVPELTLPG